MDGLDITMEAMRRFVVRGGLCARKPPEPDGKTLSVDNGRICDKERKMTKEEQEAWREYERQAYEEWEREELEADRRHREFHQEMDS